MSLKLPRHIAIIMDGNGRWATEQKMPRVEGHRRGVLVFKSLVQWAKDRGIPYLTVYAFSTENWRRPQAEVRFLMQLLRLFAAKERQHLMKQGVCLKAIGDLSRLPAYARQELEKTIEATKNNTKLTVQAAINYSGRDEILRAVDRILSSEQKVPAKIDDAFFESFLDTRDVPDPDLVIRTSGELRTSNFLVWQAAYSEYYFSEKYWPDFDEDEFDRALESFRLRARRFGGLEEQKEGVS